MALAYFPDGQRVVTGSNRGIIKVWNLENGQQEGKSMGHKDRTKVVSVTRDGTKIISSDRKGSIRVWDANLKSHKLVQGWTHEGGCEIVAISPDDRLIAVTGGRNVVGYTVQGTRLNMVAIGGPIWSMAFSPNGKKLACASGTNDHIHVYDIDNGKLSLGPLNGHQDCVHSVLWSRDGSRLFSGSWDKTIRCWNSDTGEQIGQPWTGHTNWILSLSLSPDGSILASASSDKTVRFWDATSGQPIGQHLQHGQTVNAVCFSPSGEFVASGGWDRSLYVWHAPRLNSVESQVMTSGLLVFMLIALHPADKPSHSPRPGTEHCALRAGVPLSTPIILYPHFWC